LFLKAHALGWWATKCDKITFDLCMDSLQVGERSGCCQRDGEVCGVEYNWNFPWFSNESNPNLVESSCIR